MGRRVRDSVKVNGPCTKRANVSEMASQKRLNKL